MVADHINGQAVSYDGALGTSVIKTFALTSASTGNNEKILQRLGVPYQAVHIHLGSHAGYYPGASPIAMKLLFNPENGMIYEAQAVGADGTDKRIDVVDFHRKGGLIIDVRDAVELQAGAIPGSIHIPLAEIRERMAEIPRDLESAVSCQFGLRGYIAARILTQYGYRVRNVDGGYKTYSVMDERVHLLK
ncbi:rhodanese-like domain-containing protein [Paenibacillus polymyxa]|uniref:rhodanese-like domain-containing protein n=1 Tax=Paenibacillus polymyxa TaxID=1406 RepID=UPI00287F6947|nr:rhodanese-like domain-containing protein [Paenibacillus polymyxa]